MGKHMLKYHIALPLGVFAVLVIVGLPLRNAVSISIASACIAMMLMMMSGGGHGGHHEPADRKEDNLSSATVSRHDDRAPDPSGTDG